MVGCRRIMAIQALLLAAGAARRFGSDKLTAELGGEPLVVRAARNLLAAGLPVLCVVRDAAGPVAGLVRALPGAEVSHCPEAHLGMGRSLAWGVRATRSADGWLVALGDMPAVAPRTIRALAEELGSGASLVAPQFRGRRGHPVGFARRWLPELLALAGDQGGRDLIAAHQDRLRLIATDDAGILLDVDEPGDLPGLRAVWPRG
ncbi:MAG: nucleotidyltransferase family protein [Chromatiaceae bacterium]